MQNNIGRRSLGQEMVTNPAKNISFRKRFVGREVELTEKIKLFGLSPVADELEVSTGGLRNYARDYLGIENPEYITQGVIKPIGELAYSFVGALFEKFEKQKVEIEQLRQENMELRDAEYKKQSVAKFQLMQLTEALK